MCIVSEDQPRNNSFLLQKIVLNGDGFKLFPDLFEGGLILVDGFAGTVKGFEAPDGKGDGAQGDPIFLIGQLAIFYVLGGAGEEDAEKGFFIFELAADLVIQADELGGGEGVGIEAMLEGVAVATRGADLARRRSNITACV
jgi:hypothetical protein